MHDRLEWSSLLASCPDGCQICPSTPHTHPSRCHQLAVTAAIISFVRNARPHTQGPKTSTDFHIHHAEPIHFLTSGLKFVHFSKFQHIRLPSTSTTPSNGVSSAPAPHSNSHIPSAN